MNSISPQMLDLISGNVRLVGMPGGGEDPPRGATLRRLFGFAMRRRSILIGSVAAGAVLGVVVTLVTPRQYASTVRLQISRENTQVVTVGAISRDVSIGDQEFYQTQYGLMRAQSLAERVARDLGVDNDPAFFKAFGQGDAFTGNPDRAKRGEAAADILLSHIEIAPVHGSSLVDVQARSPSPALSQRIAQTWGQDFIASNLERRMGASNYARQYLESRLGQLRDRLESSERRAIEYAAREGIFDLPAVSKSTKLDRSEDIQGRSLTSDDLIALNTELEAATADRIAAAAQLAAFSSPPDEDASAKAEDRRLAASLKQVYEAARTREQGLAQRVTALKGQFSDQRQRAVQYTIYQRDAQTNRELYDALLQRYKEIGVAGAAENNNVAVVDPARLPDVPSSPRLSVDLLLCTLAFALIGLVVAAVLEQFDEAASEAGQPAASPAALAEPARGP